MESLGNYLRDLRRARGLSLEEVARATRVASHYLEALEGNRWSQLPAPAFTKGFIRAYCQTVGEPPDEAISRYKAALSEMPPPVAVLPVTPRRTARTPVLISLILLIAFGLGLFLVSLAFRERPAPALTASMPPAASISPQPIPAASAPPEAPVVPQLQAPVQARLVARTSEPTWVRVQMDNGRVIEELLPGGATREWVSDQRFVLTIGNAGGIRLELNGRPLPPLGAKGEVIRQLVLPQDAKAPGP